MNSFSTSLRALKHPLTLSSVGLLLLNDHVLKTAIPSWLTGKLSDFAGLFFFPFLLAALLALPLDRGRLASKCVIALASSITLIWFTLIKTSPLANHLTESALAWLLNTPVQIVPDSTDLIALPMVGLAWRLWIYLERTPSRTQPGVAAYAALGLAALATIATSPCAPTPRVERVIAFGSTLYAGLTYEAGAWQGIPRVAQSEDGGRTWALPETLSNDVTRQLEQPAQRPLTTCHPDMPLVCYRITGEEKVEATEDGGQTWRVAWQVPWGRRKFMERSLYARPLAGCKSLVGIDLGPYDMTFVAVGDAQVLIVALGNEGVLVHSSNGAWRRYSVLGAIPTPYTEENLLGLVFDGLAETGISFILALITLLGLAISTWRIVLTKANGQAGRSTAWAVRPTVGVFVFFLLVGTLTAMIWFQLGRSATASRGEWDKYLYGIIFAALIYLLMFWWWITLPAIIALVAGLALTWSRVAQLAYHPKLVWKAARASVLTAFGVLLIPGFYVGLWALGAIPLYEIALGLMVLSILFILRWGSRRVGDYGQRAITPPVTSG